MSNKAVLVFLAIAMATPTFAVAEGSLAGDAEVLGNLFAPAEPGSFEDVMQNAMAPSEGLGLTFGGIAQAEYRAWDSYDGLAAGVKANLSYGFQLGNGVATVGVNINGEMDDSGEDIWVNPYASYAWNNSKISVGNIRSSFAYVVRPLMWTSSFSRGIDAEYPLGVRFDTTINQIRLSASYDEYDNLGLGGKYHINDNLMAYAAVEYNTSSDHLNSAIGIKGHQGDFAWNAMWSCFGSSSHWLEGEVSYSFNDRLTGIGYVGADFGGGSTDMYYSASLRYDLSENLSLWAGYEHSDSYDDFTVGISAAFGRGTPYRSSNPNDYDPWAQ